MTISCFLDFDSFSIHLLTTLSNMFVQHTHDCCQLFSSVELLRSLICFHWWCRSNDGKEASDQAGSSSHKSQDAQVGSLVHLLRTARPLRDPSYSSQTSRAESSEAASTSSVVSRRASDALEELQSFKEIRERLLSWSSARHQEPPEKR
jgi:hypothetical protein